MFSWNREHKNWIKALVLNRNVMSMVYRGISYAMIRQLNQSRDMYATSVNRRLLVCKQNFECINIIHTWDIMFTQDLKSALTFPTRRASTYKYACPICFAVMLFTRPVAMLKGPMKCKCMLICADL